MADRQTYKHTCVHMSKKQILKIKGTLSEKQRQSSEDKMLSHLCPGQEQGRRLFFFHEAMELQRGQQEPEGGFGLLP